MRKLLVVAASLLPFMAHAWQLPKQVVRDLEAAQVLAQQISAYDKLIPLVRYALVQTTYQQVSLAQAAAGLTEDELSLIVQVLNKTHSTHEQALDHIQALVAQIDSLLRKYKRASHCRFRPRIEAVLEDSMLILPMEAFIKAAYRLHHLFFRAKTELYEASRIMVSDDGYSRAYRTARLDFIREVIKDRYPMLANQTGNEIARLDAPVLSEARKRAEQDCLRELTAWTEETHKQITTTKHVTNALRKKTRFASFVRLGVTGALALCSGLISFGIFMSMEIAKATYHYVGTVKARDVNQSFNKI